MLDAEFIDLPSPVYNEYMYQMLAEDLNDPQNPDLRDSTATLSFFKIL